MKKRLDWIDTAKGIAILLIVLEHTTSIDHTYIGIIFTHISLPSFFCISGYFWKNNIPLNQFIKSKINSLLIPTFFFFWGACLVYWILQSIGVRFIIPFEIEYVFDLFKPTEEIYCNGVVWFLIALFWVNCIYYIVNKVVINECLQAVFVCVLGFIGVKSINIPYFLDSALTAMPFFYFGNQLQKWKIFDKANNSLKYWTIVCIGIIVLCLFSEHISMRSNSYNSPYLFHITSVCGVMMMMSLCRLKGSFSILSSKYGKYSIIVFGTHGLLINPVRRLFIHIFGEGDLQGISTFMAVILIELLVIPMFMKFFPYCCAQKSIFDLLSKNDKKI